MQCLSPQDSIPRALDQRWLLLSNPENRRAQFFREALTRAGHPPAEEIAWLDFLRDPLAFAAKLRPGLLVRIESPGENFAVWRLLAAWGADAAEEASVPLRVSREAALQLEPDHGRIRLGEQVYLGFREALGHLERAAAEVPGLRFLNHPADIAVLFDKLACQERLEAAGAPSPPSLGLVDGYDALRAAMDARAWRRVFIKPTRASSASGVVAYQLGPSGQELAITSAEMARGPSGELRLYNSLRIRRYERPADVRALIDALASERLMVQRWIPKAGLDGRTFDLRLVAIGERARHFVVRCSQGPLTNLHLGNARGDPAAFLARVDPAVWEAIRADAVRARQACAPRSLCAGIDLALETGWRRHCILEANAFGDLLPNILDAGQDTYSAQVDAMSSPAPCETSSAS
jgi:glutathione synthase/RimK-type ligase-like ATP-grasp enzyme